MRSSPLPPPLPEAIRQRLATRTHLLSTASDEQFAEFAYLFRQAEFLAQLLHAARECLENACPWLESAVPSTLPDPSTLALWEQGLILPDEIAGGTVTATVRWYIDQLRGQRAERLTVRIARDMVSLFGELQGDDPATTSPSMVP
ncbi:MAG: hypothetical protein H0X24_03760 [Ktedonobacterales bacterium]|nr:hypothetical protein [Ktedonobacterales bacterium]